MDATRIIELAIGGAGALALFWSGFKGNLSNDTIRLMKANKQAQDDAIAILRAELTEHERDAKDRDGKLSHLTGQVQTLKDIPLAQIAKSLEIVSQTHLDMQSFLKEHQDNAVVLADRISDKIIKSLKEKK